LRRIVAEAESAEQAARALQREPRGTLSISAPDTFGPMHVAPAIPEFLARFPDLAIDISLSPRHVDLVQEGLDLAIRIGTLKDSPLVVRRLAPSRLVLCAAPAYLKMRGVPRVADDLLRHACFGVSVMPWGDEWHLGGAKGEHRIAARGVLRSNSADILRAAALSGLGIAFAKLGGGGRPTVWGADAHIAGM
jgi:DNA-binding transcriptional LysR family regulator